MQTSVPSVTETPYPAVPPQYPQPVFGTAHYVAQPSATATRERRYGQKIRAAFIAAVLFVILSYHGTYRATNAVIAMLSANTYAFMSDAGCATMLGVFAHAVVFFLIVMYLFHAV